MRVLQASAEIVPLLKTGGLADVAGALPPVLGRAGADVRVLLPGFRVLRQALVDAQYVASVPLPWRGEPARLRRGVLPEAGGVTAYVLEDAALYERPGSPYADERQQPWADNHRRFALLGYAASMLAEGLDAQWRPDVLHAHDWHAGLAPAYLAHARSRGRTRTGSVFTVHNLAYQGIFPGLVFGELGLPRSAFSVHGVEFHHQVSFMKAALYYADRITTVSPTYAREVRTQEQGCGLDGLLRERADRLIGILNGVDGAVWNPAADPLLAEPYDARHTAGKAACKQALQQAVGLDLDPDAPLFAVVSRLTEQKGLHLVVSVAADIVHAGGQLMVLGSGDPELEHAFALAARAHPGRVALRLGHDEPLAHRIYAGADVVMVPSRFEPCGLSQLYGLKYGALPLVHRVGGLADTVVDCALENLDDFTATGFVFDGHAHDPCLRAVRRALALYRRPRDWRRVQRTAMEQDFGWDAAAMSYLSLYRDVAPAATRPLDAVAQ